MKILIKSFLLGCLIAMANSTFAQTTKVENEMGAISFQKVAPLIQELSKTGAYLKGREVLTQLNETLNAKTALKPISLATKLRSGAEIYQFLKPSTVILISNGLRATGVIVDQSGILITNYHVLEMFGDTLRKNDQPLFAMTSDGTFYPVTQILSCSKVNDLAIVRIGGVGDKKLSAVPIGTTQTEGSDIYVMGHPAHITYFFSKGIVAKNFIREVSTQQPDEDFRMAVTADYSLGMSGGPIVDDRGNLVGLVSAANALYGNPQQKINPQMSFKNAIPVVAIQKLIK